LKNASQTENILWPMHRGSADRRGSTTFLISSIEEIQIPSRFALLGNAPNPFNPITTIKFKTEKHNPVNLRMYSLDGKLIMSRKISNPSMGLNEIKLDLGSYSSGIYIYTLEQAGEIRSSKMILLK